MCRDGLGLFQRRTADAEWPPERRSRECGGHDRHRGPSRESRSPSRGFEARARDRGPSRLPVDRVDGALVSEIERAIRKDIDQPRVALRRRSNRLDRRRRELDPTPGRVAASHAEARVDVGCDFIRFQR